MWPSHVFRTSILGQVTKSSHSQKLVLSTKQHQRKICCYLFSTQKKSQPQPNSSYFHDENHVDGFHAHNVWGTIDSDCVYLDHNGTTPIYPAVLQEMLPYLTRYFGNPSSGHAYGVEPKAAVSLARRRILSLLVQSNSQSSTEQQQVVADDCIVFTGCGTESDNLAIELALRSTPMPIPNSEGKRKHVVTCNIEHPAILECLRVKESNGEIDLSIVPVNNEGIVSAEDIANAILPDRTALVTIMVANNEVGSLQPIQEIAQICQSAGVLFHTDAAQAVGKVSVSLDDLGHPDMVTLVGHKMGAPKGVAALYIRSGCFTQNGRTAPTGYGSCGLALVGGGQECGRRAGTENVPYIAAMGKAADLLTAPQSSGGDDDDDGDGDGDCENIQRQEQWRQNADKMERLRSRLLTNLQDGLGEHSVRVNGPNDRKHRLPNTLSVGLKNIHSGELLKTISDQVAASAGSACHASGGGVSSVLKCMNVPDDFARGTLRLSVGPGTTMEEIDKASNIIIAEVKQQHIR